MEKRDMLRDERENGDEREVYRSDDPLHSSISTDYKELHKLHRSAAMTHHDALYHNDMSHSPIHQPCISNHRRELFSELPHNRF